LRQAVSRLSTGVLGDAQAEFAKKIRRAEILGKLSRFFCQLLMTDKVIIKYLHQVI